MRKLLWHGNAAKCRVIRTLADTYPCQPIKIFDLGCGTFSQWPGILEHYPHFSVVGFEPNPESIRKARQQAIPANAILIDDFAELSAHYGTCDVIVSFSVLEHVSNKVHYLGEAKKLLAPHGTFYLNYDDGHFRNRIDLNNLHGVRPVLAEVKQNLLSRLLRGRIFNSNYQERVSANDAANLIHAAGFISTDVVYENLESFKGLYKTIPLDKREEFMEFWLEAERVLNERYRFEGASQYGDTINLWSFMPSRTLTLKHKVES